MNSLYIIRHAQSLSNVDFEILRSQTNMSVNLSEVGLQQIEETSHFMIDLFKGSFSENIRKKPIKVWNSPYERTRKTANILKEKFKINNIFFKEEESIYLSERQFGLVDNVLDYQKSHPYEYEHYILHEKSNHNYFVRPPLGESPFDMCMRLDFFLKNYIEKEDNYDHIIITHGACVRGLIMMSQGLKYEDYMKLKNPLNASVYKIDLSKNHKNYQKIFEPSVVSF